MTYRSDKAAKLVEILNRALQGSLSRGRLEGVTRVKERFGTCHVVRDGHNSMSLYDLGPGLSISMDDGTVFSVAVMVSEWGHKVSLEELRDGDRASESEEEGKERVPVGSSDPEEPVVGKVVPVERRPPLGQPPQ